MPNPEEPVIKEWLDKIQSIFEYDPEAVFIGHSIGCQAVLRFLESLPEGQKINGVVLIAPWMELDEEIIKKEGEEVIELAKPWMETPIDFPKVKQTATNFVAIFSDDDYYVSLDQSDFFAKELRAKIITEHAMGHFSAGDGISELPSVVNAIKQF